MGSCIRRRRSSETHPTKEKTLMNASKMKMAYVITERGGRSFWNKIGVAFLNADGSINVKLDSVPVSGELQIRDYVARDEQSPSYGRDSHTQGLAQTA
jgi:hypothetical protein